MTNIYSSTTTGDMMKKSIVLVLLFCFAATGRPQSHCNRHDEPQGKFSICPPSGWTVTERKGEPFKMFFDPATSTFVANMNIRTEVNNMPIAEYVAASVDYILTSYEKLGANNLKQLGQTDLSIDSGYKTIKVIFASEYKGINILSVQYYIDGGSGNKFVVTGTSLQSARDVNEPLFDSSVKTFRVSN
ncbi:MAG: hypothetical protein ABR555_12275 [Pyrinomonadaceae bacterium]